MELYKFRILSLIFGVFPLLVYMGCTGGPKTYLNLEGKGKIALISYTLNNSIVKDGDEPDDGPGLLQKKVNYYKNHQLALEGIYNAFTPRMTTLFNNAPFLAVDSVIGNRSYQTETKHTPKKILGKDITPGADKLTSSGLNYVSIYDTKKLDKIASDLQVDLLLLVENTATYKPYTAIVAAPGIQNTGVARMYVTTNVFIYEAGNRVIMEKSFQNMGDDNIPMLNGIVPSKMYPQAILSAHEKNMNELKLYITNQKQKSLEQEEKS